MQQHIGLVEIYRTSQGVVFQCNKSNRYLLDFAGHLTSIRVTDFFLLKRLVDGVDLQAMAQNADRASDYAIICPLGMERCYVLSLTEVVQLKELLSGAKVMLDLNGILKECLYGALV